MKFRLTVIDNDPAQRSLLVSHLLSKGYVAQGIAFAREAFDRLSADECDLAILELRKEATEGLSLIRTIRERQNKLPVIVITARDGIDERVAGLEAGADASVARPLELRELEATARVLLRRARSGQAEVVTVGPLELTMGQPRVRLSGRIVDLKAREFSLLEVLAARVGKVVKRDFISQQLATAGEALSDTAIEVAIHRLRRRIEPFGLRISTLRGFGYLLEPVPEKEDPRRPEPRPARTMFDTASADVA
jgi:two-component system OmpR family response regulator